MRGICSIIYTLGGRFRRRDYASGGGSRFSWVAASQGFDLPDARLMIASAMEDLAQILLEEDSAADSES